MSTQANLRKERELLAGLGLQPVRAWPAKCLWYWPDGSVNGNLPCDEYSRILYMGRGLVPSVARKIAPDTGPTEPDGLMAVMCRFIDEQGPFEGTVSELHEHLQHRATGLPGSATRLSRALSGLASQMIVQGMVMQRMPRGRDRILRLSRR